MIYERWNPKPATLALVNDAALIMEDFRGQGFKMTLRQLYYQLVARNIIPNSHRSYSRLSEVMTKARWAGMVPLDCLYDPGREPERPTMWSGPKAILNACAQSYATDRWRNAETRVELWAEKDAVASVLRPVAEAWQVVYQSARGFMGLGAMADVQKRLDKHFGNGQNVVIIYCGDHDPSGQEIPRVVHDQLERLLENSEGDPYGYRTVDVEVVALTLRQIEEHGPPPQYAKPSDARYVKYVAEHGIEDVWELDALPPNVLAEIATDAILDYLPEDYHEIGEADEETAERFREIGREWTQ